ncbi:D-glutamate cyclase family protein [Paenarthrobacter sp. NPDC091711]|uniref:D-glutamate cyclase family protein n=1 Tax=Paenarthrobacter sp. NPDC091711 TaxID=3364385 RepID=UPI00383059E2
MNAPTTTAPPTSAKELRDLASRGEWTAPTGQLLTANQQANLAIVPKDLAFDFLLFCQRNPKAAPVIAVTDVGDPILRHGTTVADLRTAIPRYRVWQHGELVDEPTDITNYWREDSVAFLLGCSFTFEGALTRAGIEFEAAPGTGTSPAYVTSIPTKAAGTLNGPLVVSLRLVRKELVARAVEITSRYPTGHGAPVHIGDPSEIGIEDVYKPDFGVPPVFKDGYTPMFWACGVTPQVVLPQSGAAYVITHAPNHLFVFDHDADELLF